MLKNASVAVIETILNAVPAVCAVTVPELPTPDVNVWPGRVSTSFEAEAAKTVKLELAGPVVAPSLAVIVVVSAFVSVVDSVVVD
ncbi:MAG: hypothetical protein Q8L37_06195 [Candidatus Gottesmanbacteria bacterium]|nr:hypothetical protein [Candidatus Gottesmanbacteria bacterium]